MSEVDVIRQTLRQAAHRRRRERALRGLWIGLLAGCLLWLVVLGLYKLLPIPESLVAWVWIAAPAGAVLGLSIAGWKPIPLDHAARLVEARRDLEQKLSTALELTSTGKSADTPWSRLVLADATAALRNLDVRRLLPFHLPPFTRWIIPILVVVVGLGFVPEYRSPERLRREQEARVIRETGNRVAELIRRELQRREPAETPAREALEAAGDAGLRLSQAKLTKADALKDLENAGRRLAEEARQLDRDPALRRLQQAARSPSAGSGMTGNPLQKQLEKMQQSLGSATPDALQKLAEQLKEAQRAANAMQAGAPDSAAQQALSQSLAQMAQTAKGMGLDLPGLQQALESLDNLQVDRLLKDLQQAGTDLDKMRDMARKLAEMQQQMQQLGKDLAEQLERGQAEAAADTLSKMVEELKAANLTPEQLEKMLAEVSKATQPASQYGNVAELLKKAGEQMKSGAKDGASKNLAAAADELRKMAQQAQDLQQLAEALQNLENAQLAILSGRAWQPGGT